MVDSVSQLLVDDEAGASGLLRRARVLHTVTTKEEEPQVEVVAHDQSLLALLGPLVGQAHHPWGDEDVV